MKLFRRTFTPKKIFLILYDVLSPILIAVLATLVLELQDEAWLDFLDIFFQASIFIFLSSLLTFSLLGFYNQMWLYASILQYFIVPIGIFVQTLLLVIYLSLTSPRVFSLPWFWMYYSGTVFALIAIRVLYRIYRNRWLGIRQRTRSNSDTKIIRVMIIGAGRAGSRMAEDLREIRGTRIPLVFIDDNPLTHTYKHMGIPVMGGRDEIIRIAESMHIDEIIIAIPSMSKDKLREIVTICQKTKCRIRILPSVTTLTEEEAKFKNVKDIEIEDLLGRDPIKIESSKIENIIKEKVVLVTGGGGSIGSELCRQISKYCPQKLIIFDIYENNAYDLQQELISRYGSKLSLEVLIGSVRDIERVRDVFEKYKPQIVYHAAAHKHVPLMEDSPEEAVKNNVIGTYNVVSSAAKLGVERFVLISTDKAVNPTSVMGASKRLAEMTVLSVSKQFHNLKCSIVRFGNVLGSNGSVIPLFKRQIAMDRKVTVTHPDMRRYFMTIPEAVSLVLQASYYAEGGEIFVLDMGEPVKILDLAEGLIRLSGYEPNVDIGIEFCGLRPGEKMFEELYFDLESLDKNPHEKIMKLKQVQDPDLLHEEINSLFTLIGHNYPEISNGILKNF